MSFKIKTPTELEIKKWCSTKTINPRSGRKIKINGPIYKILEKCYQENKDKWRIGKDPPIIDTYLDFRKDKIDPILMIDLPLEEFPNNKYFKFKYKWNPYTGERLGEDPNGPLCFDPDALIYYFYNNRLNYLWENSNDINYSGYFGDALGNGPDFDIKGRGNHPDWYLFRLPIQDCYLHTGHCPQSVTMGPKLTDKEIKEIDKLAKSYKNNFYKKYKIKRPSLRKLKLYYEEAINSNPDINIDKEVLPFIDPVFINKLKYNVNIKAVKKLINM